MALMKAFLGPIFNSTKFTTFLILGIIFPMVSMIVRLRRRPASGSVKTVDAVRKRLQAVNGAEAGVLGRMWSEAMRVITDTVRMGGSGLV